jgi:hypothetical protein
MVDRSYSGELEGCWRMVATRYWPTELHRALAGDVPGSCRVWVFGPALVRRRPREVGVLIVHQDGHLLDALELKARMLAVARARDWPSLAVVISSSEDEDQDPPAAPRRALPVPPTK